MGSSNKDKHGGVNKNKGPSYYFVSVFFSRASRHILVVDIALVDRNNICLSGSSVVQSMTKNCKVCGRWPRNISCCVECGRNVCYALLGLGLWRCSHWITDYGLVCN